MKSLRLVIRKITPWWGDFKRKGGINMTHSQATQSHAFGTYSEHIRYVKIVVTRSFSTYSAGADYEMVRWNILIMENRSTF